MDNWLDAKAKVSTHSRPKAAGPRAIWATPTSSCFNTQPPEGGWDGLTKGNPMSIVSTHSRPKAAGP